MVCTEVFGKRVRKPADMTDDVDFEYFALSTVEQQANNFIDEHHLSKSDILTYKVKCRRKTERVKIPTKLDKVIMDNVEYIYARVYLSYWVESDKVFAGQA